MREEVSCQKIFFWLNNLAILYGLCILDISFLHWLGGWGWGLILVFFIDRGGGYLISIAYCPFFHFNSEDVQAVHHLTTIMKVSRQCHSRTGQKVNFCWFLTYFYPFLFSCLCIYRNSMTIVEWLKYFLKVHVFLKAYETSHVLRLQEITYIIELVWLAKWWRKMIQIWRKWHKKYQIGEYGGKRKLLMSYTDIS